MAFEHRLIGESAISKAHRLLISTRPVTNAYILISL